MNSENTQVDLTSRSEQAPMEGDALHDKRCPAALNVSDPCNCGNGLDFSKAKPPKCVHCKLPRMLHRAVTYQCPAKWSKGRIGYTHYEETIFSAKEPA